MSKTTTISNTKNLRGASHASDATNHSVTWGKGENQRQFKDNYSSNLKKQEGYVLGEPIRGRSERRVSVRNNSDPKTIRNLMTGDSTASNIRKEMEKPKVPRASSNILPQLTDSDTQKVPLEDYYRKAGLDYKLLRKNCKIRVNGEGTGSTTDTGVYYDSYQLPEGYTAEDLPDSQGLTSQNPEDPISPAVMIAAHQRKTRSKVLALTPETDSDELIRRLRKGGRKKEPEVNPGSKSRVETIVVPPQDDFNDTFPDDSLNDSDLVMASQQAEYDHANYPCKDAYKRDINGNSKNPSPHTPMTSTPIQNPGPKNVMTVKETPKTARAVSRSRHRSNAHSQSDIFESSVLQNDEHGLVEPVNEADEEAAPRKLLKFDESPIKNVELGMECDLGSGEFEDDGVDEMLSQIPMPGEIREPKGAMFESSAESASQLIGEGSNSKSDMDTDEMDSFLDENDLATIAKLEEIHCSSTGSTGSTGKSATSTNSRDLKTSGRVDAVAVAFAKETPRTRARRQGLSRRKNVK